MERLAMDEQDQWLTLYIILVFAAFIPGLALLAARFSTEGTTHTSHGMRGLPPLKQNPDATERGEARSY
jgi:hypothetical protein